MIPLSSPSISEDDISEVLDVLKSGQLSMGRKTEEFERSIAGFTGVKHAIAVNSGTSALHLILRSVGIGRKDVVITTSFSFIASSNCIIFDGGIPIFADIDPETLNLSPDSVRELIDRIEKGEYRLNGYAIQRKDLKAILVVDVFGQPADWDEFEPLSRDENLILIEDSCEAIGAEYKGKKAGSFGVAGAFAFYPNKQITTGEGGMIVTNDGKIDELCRSMRNQGRKVKSEWLEHVRLGYNYRMDEMSAALGLSQLRRIDEILEKREMVARRYNEMLRDVDGVETPFISPKTTRMSWFVYVVKLDENIDRDRVMDYMGNEEIESIQTRAYFPAIHLQKFYREEFGYSEGFLPITESISKRTLALPFYTDLKEEDQEKVVHKLRRAIELFGR